MRGLITRSGKGRGCHLPRWILTFGLTITIFPQAQADEISAAAARLQSLVVEIKADYPDVRHISVAQLKSDFPDALLIDVRDRDEYEVSHLPGALHAPEPADVDALRAQYPDRPLVFYCTVGVRSAIATRDFLARAKTRSQTGEAGDAADEPITAVNLAGSIFAWANQGEPLVEANGPTTEVHPYSIWWRLRYLDPDRPQ